MDLYRTIEIFKMQPTREINIINSKKGEKREGVSIDGE